MASTYLKSVLMKILNIRYAVILFSTLIIGSCKKTSDGPPQGFRFEYDSKTYTRDIVNNLADCGLNFNDTYDAIGVTIAKPDIFGSKIIFYAPDCACLFPASWDMDENCNINTNGESFDSSKVYYYKSGSFKSTKSNCIQKSGTDIVTGLRYTYLICDYAGSFSLILENNKSETIEIRNGSFDQTYQFHL
jgi:hypothetical protein